MSRPIPASAYVEHFDPELAHHRAWLLAVLEQLMAHDPQALEEGGTLRLLWTEHQQSASATGSQPSQIDPLQSRPQPPGPAAPIAEIPAAAAVAMPLVKEFEGCRLSAYPDPETGAEPWTIGWGTTTYYDGTPVKAGDTISQELAVGEAFSEGVALLAGRLERDWGLLKKLVPGWPQFSVNQQAALLSFTCSCGPAWFGSEGFATLTTRLCRGELDKVPAALMLYVNPGGPSEAGLRRRRKAEAALWSAAPVPSPGTGPGSEPSCGNPLSVPWFSQLDSSTDQARRMCFSSSCAMLVAFLRPGVLSGANGDDQYLQRVRRYGDTTDPDAQIKALASYGIEAEFSKQASLRTIEAKIAAGIPVPCGYLHRGPVEKPAGGGHWLIVIGHTPTHLIVHDPLGEADLVSGATIGGTARFCRCSRRNYRCAGLRLRPALDGGGRGQRLGGDRQWVRSRLLSAVAWAGGGSAPPPAEALGGSAVAGLPSGRSMRPTGCRGRREFGAWRAEK
jgi:GH24 family phage-related lysozyme (muramidase)